VTENNRTSETHLILRRFRSARATGTAHGAECSCGDLITAASPRTRDDLVSVHLDQARAERKDGAA
jgi:hypothetical protein